MLLAPTLEHLINILPTRRVSPSAADEWGGVESGVVMGRSASDEM
jgi:hypothetical protein